MPFAIVLSGTNSPGKPSNECVRVLNEFRQCLCLLRIRDGHQPLELGADPKRVPVRLNEPKNVLDPWVQVRHPRPLRVPIYFEISSFETPDILREHMPLR